MLDSRNEGGIDLELSQEDDYNSVSLECAALDAAAVGISARCREVSTEPSIIQQEPPLLQIETCKQQLADLQTEIQQVAPLIRTTTDANAFQRIIIEYQTATNIIFQKQIVISTHQNQSLKRILKCLDLELPDDIELDQEKTMQAVCDFDLEELRADLAAAKEKQLMTNRCLKLSEDLVDATLAMFQAQIAQGDIMGEIQSQIESAKEQVKTANENFIKRARIEKCKVISCKVGLILIVVAVVVVICAVIGLRVTA